MCGSRDLVLEPLSRRAFRLGELDLRLFVLKELLDEWDWDEHFAAQPQTERHLNYVADKFDLRRDIQFDSRISAAHYREETCSSKVADFLFYGICGGTGKPAFKDERARVTAAIFWMKTRGGWSETSTHRHTGVANGDPIEVEVGTVRERLMRRIARIAAATTTCATRTRAREKEIENKRLD